MNIRLRVPKFWKFVIFHLPRTPPFSILKIETKRETLICFSFLFSHFICSFNIAYFSSYCKKMSAACLLLQSLLVALLLASTTAASTLCTDRCRFTPADSATCHVVGAAPGATTLLRWPRAPAACLDALGIRVVGVAEGALRSAFPRANGTGGSVTAFASLLKNTDTTVTRWVPFLFRICVIFENALIHNSALQRIASGVRRFFRQKRASSRHGDMGRRCFV